MTSSNLAEVWSSFPNAPPLRSTCATPSAVMWKWCWGMSVKQLKWLAIKLLIVVRLGLCILLKGFEKIHLRYKNICSERRSTHDHTRLMALPPRRILGLNQHRRQNEWERSWHKTRITGWPVIHQWYVAKPKCVVAFLQKNKHKNIVQSSDKQHY